MNKYIFFFIEKIKNLANPAISLLSRCEHSYISPKAKIYRQVKLDHSKVEDYTYIAPGSRILYASIGKYCSIGRDCSIGLGLHPLDLKSTSPLFISKHNALGKSWVNDNLFKEYKQIYIGNDVWIGEKASIMGGVKIGDGAVIGTGAIVTKDVPPYAIAVGIPAKIIRYRFSQEIIKRLLKEKWWDKAESYISNHINEFQKPL